jgi:uroporphyrinogen III methyltransferase/synthase
VTPLVSLIGAGPGDPGLLTLRGAQRIREADTVMCDALVHPSVIAHARPDAEVLVVGKRGGECSATQEEIVHLMLLRARQGRRVARVKGGDPMVFGRAAEELEFLTAQGVACEVVPGVTAALGASASARIPLTHRDHSASVALLTATERPDRDDTAHDWPALARGAQTLVIYMGLRRVRETLAALVTHGRAPSTPAAVVSHATLASQRVVVGSLEDLADRVDAAALPSPALIIVGDVVGVRDRLGVQPVGPLQGRRVLVTRAPEQAEGLTHALREAGAEVLEFPAIRIDPAVDDAPLRAAVRDLARRPPTVLALSSANAVEHFFAALADARLDARALAGVKVVAIGPATAEALRRKGIEPDAVSPRAIGEGLADAVLSLLGPAAPGARVLIPRAEEARDAPLQPLRDAGCGVEVVTAYRTVSALTERAGELRAALTAGVDAVTLLSASAARSLCDALGPDASTLLLRTAAVTIGPQTSLALRERGVAVAAEADPHTAEGVVDALTAFFLHRPH